MMPKITAPIGRVESASVSASAMSGRVFPNDRATSSMTNVRTKKSNASSVQPRNPASTAFRWFASSGFVSVDAISGFLRSGSYMLFQVNSAIQKWVSQIRDLTTPDEVVYCDGSETEQKRVIA